MRGSGQIYQEVRLQGRVTGGRNDDLYDCPEGRLASDAYLRAGTGKKALLCGVAPAWEV